MRRGWRQMAAALLAVSMLGVAGCGGSDQKNEPASPTPSASPTSPSSPATEEPGGPPTGWEDKYSADELNAYNAALARWQRYNELTEPIYKAGRDTPEARKIIREYELQWRRAISDLVQYYDKGGLRNEVPPSSLWTQAISVSLNPDGTGTVIIEQCTDYRSAVVTKDGKPAEGAIPKHPITLLAVHMAKAKGNDWKVAALKLADKTSCEG